MEYLLQTRNLTKQFKKHKAVNNVNMHISQGDIYGFIGRNGAGKTTFLKMIGGLSTQTSGEIEMFGLTGKDVKSAMPRIGVLIESPGIYKGMTAYENLKLKCIAAGVNRKGYIEELLDIVGLSNVGKKKAGNFSLGMKQRLGIAMALVGEPDLLLLDEPINGLDPQGIVEIRDTILKLNKERNITIVISSHILEELSKIATKYGIINNGVLIEEITREELSEKCCEYIEIKTPTPQNAVVILEKMGFSNYKNIDSNTIQIYERIDESASINMELAKNNIMVEGITVMNQNIEDYFLNITGGYNNA